MKIFQPKTKSVFLPEFRRRPKKKEKRSSLKFSLFFGPKLGKDQKRKVFTQIYSKKRSSPTVSVLKHSAQVTKGGGGGGGGGGGACHNFAYNSMLIILSWRPKRGTMAQRF